MPSTCLTLRSIKTEQTGVAPDFLRELRDRLGLTTFIETGTYQGATTAVAASLFSEVHTIELAPALHANAAGKFAGMPHVHTHLGDSAKLLPEILQSGPRERILFWLDGHYSGGSTARGAVTTPILDELRALDAAGLRECVVLVDDLRIFQRAAPGADESLAGYPTIAELRDALRAVFPQLRFAHYGDVAIACDAASGLEFSPVVNACTASRLYDAVHAPDDPGHVLELFKAEQLIATATGAEAKALLALAGAYPSAEKHGLGGHYHLWAAFVLAQQRDFTAALKQFNRALELGCQHWRLQCYLAACLDGLGERAEALLALNEARQVAPEHLLVNATYEAILGAPDSPACSPGFSPSDLAGPAKAGIPSRRIATARASPADLHRNGEQNLLRAKPQMLDLAALAREHALAPRGVIHIGAHEGKEFVRYREMGFQKILFVEANPAVFARLQANLGGQPGVILAQCAISDCNGTAQLRVTSMDQSSSLLPLKLHKKIYPDIVETQTVAVRTVTIDSLLAELSLDPADFNFLNLDIQGAELLALRGAEKTLRHIEGINCEVNLAELYEGCARLEEIDCHLQRRDFARVAMTTPFHPSWGDAFYVRQSVVSMSSLGTNGRFANQLFQYAFLKCYARDHGVRVETPAWVGQKLFGCADPPVSRPLPELRERTNLLADAIVPNAPEPFRNVDFWGYFQYNTRYYAPHREYIRSLFRPAPEILPQVQPKLERLRRRGKTVVGLHLRRGDYGYEHFFVAPAAWYLDWLHGLWPTLDQPVLFIASDEPAKVLADFAEYQPLTAKDLGPALPGAPFYPDFFLLSQCDVLAISNSSFSFAAAMLNERATIFARPHLPTARLIPFDPWKSETIFRDAKVAAGGTGDSPVPVGDSPTGTTTSQPSKANALWEGTRPIPSGESPDGTGQWPVLPARTADRLEACPTFSFVTIVLNGMPFLELALRAAYDFAHEIIIVEGAVEHCRFAAHPDGSSKDGTVECIRHFPDPQNKIRLIQGVWPEKCEMQNAALEHVTGDYVWLMDADEIYRHADLEKVRQLVLRDPTITQINVIPDNFWKGFDHLLVSPRFFEPAAHYRRIFKFAPGARFTSHRPPTMLHPGSKRTTEQQHCIPGEVTRAMSIVPFHYSYVVESQVAQKVELYNRYGWAKEWKIDMNEWLRECWQKWTPENRAEIEKCHPVWTGGRDSRTEPFTGEHPEVMREFIERWRRESPPMNPPFVVQALACPTWQVRLKPALQADGSWPVSRSEKDPASESHALSIIGHSRYLRRTLANWQPIELDAPLQKRRAVIEQHAAAGTPFWNNHVGLAFLADRLQPASYLEIGCRTAGSFVQVLGCARLREAVAVDLWAGHYSDLPNTRAFAAQQIERFLKASGGTCQVELRQGNSHVELKKLIAEGRKFELINVDGDHTDDGALQDLEDALQLLANRGAILFDDIVHPGFRSLLDVAKKFAAAHPVLQLVLNTTQDNGVAVFLKGIDATGLLNVATPAKPSIATPPRRVKVAGEVASKADLTQVDSKSAFAQAIRALFARIRPTKIIETGTYLGTGTTKVIAEAIRDLKLNETIFHSIEVKPQHHETAKANLAKSGLGRRVQLHLGLSVPRRLLPTLQQIEEQTVRHVEFDDLFVDHQEPERALLYFKETDFTQVPEDLLGRCLREFGGRPDFVLLDSAGHMGHIEFDYLLSQLTGPCHIALDDIHHIKHHRSFRQMQRDPRFELLVSSNEKFGFCLAKFTPAATQGNGPAAAERGLQTASTQSLFENVGQASSLTVHGASLPRVSGGKMPPKPADRMSAPHFQTGAQDHEPPGTLDNTPLGDVKRRERRAPVPRAPVSSAPDLSVQRLLWVRTDAIGDAVLAASMLPHIRAKYPAAKIAVLCREHVAGLYLACPHVATVICFDWQKASQDEAYRNGIIGEIAEYQPDLVLNSTWSREAVTELLALSHHAPQIVGMEGDLSNISAGDKQSLDRHYTRLISSPGAHKLELERHRDFLAGLGLCVEKLEPQVWTTPEDEELAAAYFAQEKLDPALTIALFPGAQNDRRIYPHYAAALQPFHDHRFLLFGDEKISRLAAEISATLPGACLNLAGKTSLRETAALLRRCRLYVGAESAGAHLACALGVPNVVVLGGGHFGRFMPYSPLTSVACLPLDCFGCDWRCRHARPHCVKDVATEVVTEAVRETLARASTQSRLFVQGPALWTPQAGQPRLDSVERFLTPDSFEVIPVGAASAKVASAGAHSGTPPDFVGQASSLTVHGASLPRGRGGKDAAGTGRQDVCPTVPIAVPGGAPTAGPPVGPLVTAIVSTYNSARFLRGCLEDLEAQTIADRLEIIVVDSGSEQNERAIAEEFQQRHGNIVYLRTEREPLYAAWNRALGVARGRYVTNANTDDRHRADAYEILARALDEHPVGIVYADSLLTRVENETFAGTRSSRTFQWPEFTLKELLLRNFFGPHPMWRRSVHDAVGLFNPDFAIAGDYDFNLRVAARFGARRVDEVLGLYLEGGLEWRNREQCVRETRQILRHHRRAIVIEDVYPALRASDLRAQSRAKLFIDYAVALSKTWHPDPELARGFYQRAFALAPELVRTLEMSNVGQASRLPRGDKREARQDARFEVNGAGKMPALRSCGAGETPALLSRSAGWSFCIITNGKRPEKLGQEIESIRALNIPSFEILVGGEAPAGLGEDVVVVPVPDAARNGRLGEMRNRLIERARFDHLVVADDDMIFHGDFYSGLQKFGEDYEVQCVRLLNPDGTRFWDWATVGGPRGQTILDYDETDRFSYVTGGLCVMKASVADRVKWDEGRGFYQAEDVDFSRRLQQAGVTLRFNRHSTVTHNDPRYTLDGPVVVRIEGALLLARQDYEAGRRALARHRLERVRRLWPGDSATAGALQLAREFNDESAMKSLVHGSRGPRPSHGAAGFEVKLPIRWVGPLFSDSPAAKRGAEILQPLAARLWLGALHHGEDYDEAAVQAWPEGPRESLFALTDRFPSMLGGVAVSQCVPEQFVKVPGAARQVGFIAVALKKFSREQAACCGQMDEIWVVSKSCAKACIAAGVEARKVVIVADPDAMIARLQEIEAALLGNAGEAKSALPSSSPPTRSVSVAWEGSFLDLGSLSHVNRELTTALAVQPGLEITCIGRNRLPREVAKMPALQDMARRLRAQPPQPPQVTVRHAWPPNWDAPPSGAWVVIQPWEFGALPVEWVQHLARVDEAWVPSEFVRRSYIESGVDARKVHVVPNGIDPGRFRPEAKPLALATRKTFKFLFVGGTIHRKGPDLLLQAYLDSFTSSDDVCLVIKDFGGQGVYAGQTLEQQIHAARQRPDAPEILYLTADIAAEAMPGLYTACDSLVHPYRGEGFGLPVLEAMACGLPVVVTGGGSTDDFATEDLAYRLPAVRKEFGQSVSGMKLVKPGWLLEPDSAALAGRLKWIVSHRDEARARGRAASDQVRREWTWDRAARVAALRLQDLVTRREAAASPPAPRAARPIELPACAKVGHLGEARSLFKQGKLLPAWNATVAAWQLRPFHPEALQLLAELARAAGDTERAKTLARRARELAPKWKPAKQFLKSGPVRGKAAVELPALPQGLSITREAARPTPLRLSVCLITKNEERFLGQCLESVRSIADQIVVVDTGSTDWTTCIAERFGAEVYQFDWCDDFSAARNAALEHATGDWVLMLDADEELPAPERERLLKLMQDASAMAFRLPMIDVGREDEGVSHVPRLFRNAPGLFYVGRVHEQVFSSIEARRAEWGLENKLGDATLLHHGYTKELVQSRDKVARNLRLLEMAILEMPGEPNLLMNLGLELVRAGRLHEGLERYAAAFRAMSALPKGQAVPELRESLLTQFATHLLNARQFAEIVRVLTSPLATTGGLTASQHWLLGLAQIESKKYAEGAEQMRQCLASRGQPALTPVLKEIRGVGPHHCLALCLAALQQPGASEAFQDALRVEPGNRRVRFDFARLLAETGQGVEALKWLHQLVTEDASDPLVWQLGGRVALNRPELLEFACDWTGEAIQLHPHHEAIVEQRATALLLSGQPEAALPLWRRAAEASHPMALAASMLCEICTGGNPRLETAELATKVDQELLKWYRRLLQHRASSVILELNRRMEEWRKVAPIAAGRITAALAEAA